MSYLLALSNFINNEDVDRYRNAPRIFSAVVTTRLRGNKFCPFLSAGIYSIITFGCPLRDLSAVNYAAGCSIEARLRESHNWDT